jgi:hypothetical protein
MFPQEDPVTDDDREGDWEGPAVPDAQFTCRKGKNAKKSIEDPNPQLAPPRTRNWIPPAGKNPFSGWLAGFTNPTEQASNNPSKSRATFKSATGHYLVNSAPNCTTRHDPMI